MYSIDNKTIKKLKKGINVFLSCDSCSNILELKYKDEN